jgi:PAS domain-containing protein
MLSFPDGGKYILSSIIDITEQEAFEKRLEEERQRYKTALSIGSFAFFSIDLTEGKLCEPIITKNGENLLNGFGISIPAYYDDFARIMFGEERIVSDSEKINMLRSRKRLIAAYKEGIAVIDLDYRVTDKDRNIHLIVMLHKKDKNVIASFIFYDNK